MPSDCSVDDAEKGVAEECYAVPLTLQSSRPSLVSQDTCIKGSLSHPCLPLPSLPHAKFETIALTLPSKELSPNELALIRKPTKKRVSSWVKFRLWYNTYRRFFTVALLFNFISLICAATRTWEYPRNYTGAWILGNLLFSVLVRTELFTRFLYLVLCSAFAKWPPLWFRLGISSTLQHVGGIHSGCAISAVMWLIFKCSLIFYERISLNGAILAFGVLTNLAVGFAMLSAMPWLRNTHHNVFERHHRFIGWTGVVFTWVFVFLGDAYDSSTRTFHASKVAHQQDFWFLLFMTILIIIPWLTVRRVPVEITIPSPKVAIIKLKRGMRQGLVCRISEGPLMEYHAFGTISEGIESGEHYLISGVQGDFTRRLVENPPTHLWTRELKFAAVGATSSLYRRGLRVCTGTGLGACLSTCIQNPNWYLLWMGSDQEKTFGPEISGLIKKHLYPDRVTLWDSKARGTRANTVKIIKDIYHAWGAEVVIITTNAQGNKEMTEGLKDAGIPCFGTLWDF
ncbi:hypothetical protein IW261DRAFT_1398516 [Armillaria novae-zelandiae]|uniref:Non-ribosomal peptide synthetase n=1 Tax=Armillaria novae-zelandiae TaxID=153914 RepID=A0AA39PBP5_9AGAR|nr:hypothetical protein IW261DRAFT_1398516 [Armillaria novae-zelandiae]